MSPIKGCPTQDPALLRHTASLQAKFGKRPAERPAGKVRPAVGAVAAAVVGRVADEVHSLNNGVHQYRKAAVVGVFVGGVIDGVAFVVFNLL